MSCRTAYAHLIFKLFSLLFFFFRIIAIVHMKPRFHILPVLSNLKTCWHLTFYTSRIEGDCTNSKCERKIDDNQPRFKHSKPPETTFLASIVAHLVNMKSINEETRYNSWLGLCYALKATAVLKEVSAAAEKNGMFIETAIQEASMRFGAAQGPPLSPTTPESDEAHTLDGMEEQLHIGQDARIPRDVASGAVNLFTARGQLTLPRGSNTSTVLFPPTSSTPFPNSLGGKSCPDILNPLDNGSTILEALLAKVSGQPWAKPDYSQFFNQWDKFPEFGDKYVDDLLDKGAMEDDSNPDESLEDMLKLFVND